MNLRRRRSDLALARFLASASASALARDLASASDIASDIDRDLGLGLDCALALVEELDRAYSFAEAVRKGSRGAGKATPAPARPVRTARRVHGWAMHLLSPAARARHEDELLDELYDLVDQRASWRRQVACAVRQLASVRQLRAVARAERGAARSAIGE
jgi:hypothetical protein